MTMCKANNSHGILTQEFQPWTEFEPERVTETAVQFNQHTSRLTLVYLRLINICLSFSPFRILYIHSRVFIFDPQLKPP
jgi:hypothetical protein